MASAARIVFAIAALAFLCFAIFVHRMAIEARSWSPVQGTVSEAGVVAFGSGSDGATGIVEEHNPSIRYVYVAEGKTYTGHRIRVWDVGFNRASLADNYIGNRRKGDSLTVFYDPARPENAVVDLAYPISPVALSVAAAIACSVVAAFAKPMIRSLSGWLLRTEL